MSQSDSVQSYLDIRPQLQLSGLNGNCFSIFARVSHITRSLGCPRESFDIIIAEMKSGDYDNLIQVCHKYFEVT